MSAHVVWVDHRQGKAFTLLNESEYTHTSVLSENLQGTRGPGGLFNAIAALIKETDGFLIVGPCLAKHLFTNHLAEHHPRLFRKITGCEYLEHATEPRIRALSARFFKKP